MAFRKSWDAKGSLPVAVADAAVSVGNIRCLRLRQLGAHVQFKLHAPDEERLCHLHADPTFGGMIELPLTLPMDEARHASGTPVDIFWESQVELALKVIGEGGLVMISLHPQPHQAANLETLKAVDRALQRIATTPKVWVARPGQLADHVDPGLQPAEDYQ